jgi:hypothetical protein
VNTIPLPAGPFFCADEGRYLPGLTPGSQIADRRWEIVEALAEVEIEFAAMVQRREIEEELLKARLKQRCFVALAERAPGALVVRNEELEVSGSVCSGDDGIAVSPQRRSHSPVAQPDDVNANHGHEVARQSAGPNDQSKLSPYTRLRSSIKVFPMAPISPKETGSAGLEPAAENGALRQQCPAGFGVYPKGRW